MKALRSGQRGCLPFAVVVLLTTQLGAANWPQWRGPQGQGVSAEVSFPLDWSVSSHVLWKIAIPGRGHSTPVIWGNRLFLTMAVEGATVPDHKAPLHFDGTNLFLHPDSMGVDRSNTLKVLAIDTASGKTLWEQVAYDGPMFDNRHKRSSYASATPVTDGERVYVHFGAEGTYAYDFAGKLLWKTTVGQIKTMGLGVGASPILYRDVLILQCDEDSGEQSFVVALDTRMGREVWRTRRNVQVSWSTPVLVDVPAAGGVPAHTELVTNGNEWIVAYDPATGRELWRTAGVKSNAIHTPLVGEGLVIATAGFPERRVMAIRPGGTSTRPESDRIAWTYDKGTAYVVSPILYKGSCIC
jgi:outer membrane protein assembly factor BamB